MSNHDLMTRLAPDQTPASRRLRRGFTLVELLVVIGIIAVLISILLPSLNRVRKQANTVKCAANIRALLGGMSIYAAENRGAIPGSAWTTARFMFRNADPTTGIIDEGSGTNGNRPYGTNNLPGIIQPHDWASPIAKTLRISFNEGHLQNDRRARYIQFTETEPFRCPENEFLATAFTGSGGGTDWGVRRTISYSTPLAFMVRHASAVTTTFAGVTTPGPGWNVPTTYTPNINEVGQASRKIFLLDGSRFATAAAAPTYNSSFRATFGGSFSEYGGWSRFSRAWDRGLAPGNTPQQTGNIDARVYSFRHGAVRPRGAADTFKLNVGFFDGHVETLGDLEVSEPSYWIPKGGTIDVDATQLHADVIRRYYPNYSGSTFTVR